MPTPLQVLNPDKGVLKMLIFLVGKRPDGKEEGEVTLLMQRKEERGRLCYFTWITNGPFSCASFSDKYQRRKHLTLGLGLGLWLGLGLVPSG